MRSSRCALLMLVSAVLLQLGCSGPDRPKMALVTGVVTYKGAPVSGATVGFSSPTAPRGAAGVTDESGKYQLSTFDSNDGAVLGDYKVTIFKADPAAIESPESKMIEVGTEKGGPPGAGSIKMVTTRPTGETGDSGEEPGAILKPAGPKSLLPSKYADPGKSGLTAKVEDKENKFDFSLDD